MKTNRPVPSTPIYTHEGGNAVKITNIKTLRRMTLSALLFEDEFYQKGSSHAAKVAELVSKCDPEAVMSLAIECRTKMFLRHMPLFLIRELAKVKGNGQFVQKALEGCILRPDELTEYLALYWKDNKDAPLSAGSKRGLASAFKRFSSYDLAKYDNQRNAFKLKDVLRLVHPRPDNEDQSRLWKDLISGELASADTWEVALSAGGDKKETFERLIKEKKLGGLAFLRNLRNIISSGVDPKLVRERFQVENGFKFVLPFRFVTALRYAPQYVADLEDAMLRAVKEVPVLGGRTALLVDVSGSMDRVLSAKSEAMRLDVAGGLAILVNNICEDARVFTFSRQVVEVPGYKGLGLIQTIKDSQPHDATYLGRACEYLYKEKFDRLIVITDEQTTDRVPPPPFKSYLINVASYNNGVGYNGNWVHIDGWSDRVIDFIREYEKEE